MEKKEVIVVGATGRMGRIVCDLIAKSEDMEVLGGLCHSYGDRLPGIDLHVKAEHMDCHVADVIIDFSRPEATMEILPYALHYRIPMVIATTGFSGVHENAVLEASYTIPIFKSANMGLGTKRFIQIVKNAASILPGSYEISIHEVHHSGKADAPSGTAKMLFTAVNEARNSSLRYRFDSNDKKSENEVWVSSERIGNFRGEHTVTICGENEYFRFTHSIQDRAVFAEGALEAARFIMQQTEPRIYTMDDLFDE